LSSREITIETNIKKRKADCELKTIKKSKVGHFMEIIKQKAILVDKKKVLKPRKNKNLKNKKPLLIK